MTVRGIVTSADDKQPLIGVNVISGATSGVSTLADGSYSISVAAGTTLTFQYIGYKPATFTVPGGSASLTYNVSLESEAQGRSTTWWSSLTVSARRHHRRIGIDRQGRKGREHPYGGVRSGHPGTGSRTDGTFQFG